MTISRRVTAAIAHTVVTVHIALIAPALRTTHLRAPRDLPVRPTHLDHRGLLLPVLPALM